MKRGFTLIELLVVVSIISMLSSVVLASVSFARAKARDSTRLAQIHQIDIAIQLYINDHGSAPNLYCSSYDSSCIAISNQGNDNWDTLKDQLSPYISDIKDDPCGNNCTIAKSEKTSITKVALAAESPTIDELLGYVYYAPSAVAYYCLAKGGCTAGDSDYHLYATMERDSTRSGVTTTGSFFTSGTTPPPVDPENS